MVQTQIRSSILIAPEPVPVRRESRIEQTRRTARRPSPVTEWAREIADLRKQIEQGEDIFATLEIERPVKRRRTEGYASFSFESFAQNFIFRPLERALEKRTAKRRARAAHAARNRPRKGNRKYFFHLKNVTSFIIGSANLVTLLLVTAMIVYLVSFLGGAYTRTSEVQSACTLERLAASTVFTPVQNETISIEVSTRDLANSTIALAAPNRETENYIFVGFFSSALSYMGYLTESGSLYVIGSQGCSINLTSGSNLRTGHLGAHCEISVSSVLTCTRHCYGNFTPYEWSEVIDNTLTIQNAMETRNSYGFGVTTTYEEIQSIRLVDMEDAQWWAPNASIEVLVETKVFSSVSSNASENLGRWQDTMLFVFVIVLLVNILSRLLISRLLFTGTKVYNARIALRGEIVGSLITSPSVSVFTISIFALMGSHIYSNALLFGEIQTTKVGVGFSVATACITAFNMRIVASSLGFRFSSSGVMVLAYCLPTIPMLAPNMYTDAVAYAGIIGQFRSEQVTFGCSASTEQACYSTPWIGLSPASASGIELSSRLLWRPVSLAMCFFVLAEGILAVVFAFGGRRKGGVASNSIVQSPGMVSPLNASGTASSSGFFSSNTIARSLSSYERALAFEGRAPSHFSKIWAAPVVTVFGSYHHFISLVEDNLTMWGVLLLPLDTYILVRIAALFFDTENLTYFLIRRRLYVGVLVSGDTLVSRFENRRKIPRYVQDYPFHLWNGQTPNSILLR